MRVIFAILVCGMLVATWAATGTAGDSRKQGRLLSGAEIIKYFSGAKFDVFDTEDYPLLSSGDVMIEFRLDGKLYGETPSGAWDDGKWWVNDNRICRKWNSWVDGYTSCFDVTLERDYTRQYNADGSFHSGGKLLSGPAARK